MAATALRTRVTLAMRRLHTATNSRRATHTGRAVINSSDKAEETRDKASSSPSLDKTGAQTAKTIAQQDKELEEKLAGRAGDGGSAGLEYENGQAVSMKRSVKNNMFRYI
ncbi:hypothetical protein CC79DRAFT_1328629 [Sarocladium strictum]